MILVAVAIAVIGTAGVAALYAADAWRQHRFDRLEPWDRGAHYWDRDLPPDDGLPLWRRQPPAAPYDWEAEP